MKNIMFAIAKRDFHVMQYHEVHKEIEMYYLRQGERLYFVENRTFHLTEGTAIFISSNRIHKTSAAGNQSHERLLLEIHPDFLNTCYAMFPDVSFDFLFSQTAVVSTPNSAYNPAIRQTFEEIARLTAEKPFGYEAEIQLNVFKLFLNFQRTISGSYHEHILFSPKHQKIYEVLEYIGSNMEHISSLDDLCQHFFISKYYLCHSFKEVTGMSVMAFLNMTRVLRASVLLRDGQLSISQVAKAVGLNSVAHLTDVFKRLEGMTPHEYRRLHELNPWQNSSNYDTRKRE